MAQLTLSEKSTMANNGYFQQRIQSSLKVKALFWLIDAAPPTFPDNNTATYKRKLFAKQIMQGGMPNIQAYSEYLLNKYKTENPVIVTEEGTANGQLADSELTAGEACEAAYDYFAGIEPKDL